MKYLVYLAFIVSAFWSSSALALTINAGNSPYNNLAAVQGINIHSEGELREAAMLALVSAYRATHGVSSIPMPSDVQIVYEDGSKEKAVVICLAGTACVKPKPNTTEPAGSGGGGGGGGGSGGGGGGPGMPGCIYGCGPGTVTVGDPKQEHP